MASLRDFFNAQGLALLEVDARLHRLVRSFETLVREQVIEQRKAERAERAESEAVAFRALPFPIRWWRKSIDWFDEDSRDRPAEASEIARADRAAGGEAWHSDGPETLREVAERAGHPEYAPHLVRQLVQVLRQMHLLLVDSLDEPTEVSWGLQLTGYNDEGRPTQSLTTFLPQELIAAMDELLDVAERETRGVSYGYNLAAAAQELEDRGTEIRFGLFRDVAMWQLFIFHDPRFQYEQVQERLQREPEKVDAELAERRRTNRILETIPLMADAIRGIAPTNDALSLHAFDPADLRTLTALMREARESDDPEAAQFLHDVETIAEAARSAELRAVTLGPTLS